MCISIYPYLYETAQLHNDLHIRTHPMISKTSKNTFIPISMSRLAYDALWPLVLAKPPTDSELKPQGTADDLHVADRYRTMECCSILYHLFV